MAAWHEDARFYIFADCDVFIEDDGNYLYVENEPFDYNGNYTCCIYYQCENHDGAKWYDRGEHVAVSNEYVNDLEKAPWDVAQCIISHYLAEWALHEDGETADIINDAKANLMNNATAEERFVYC